MKISNCVLTFFIIFLWSKSVWAVNPFLDWQTTDTNHFQIHFAKEHQRYAQRVANIAETVHTRLSSELNWSPKEKTHLVLSDESDFANGFATVVNVNRSVLYFAPPTSINSLEDYDNWLHLLITHEYTHLLHLDKVAGAPGVFRKIFGRFLLTFPNLFEPSWLVEGLATYKETNHKRKVGRGQSTLFKSMMRMEVASGIKSVNQVNLPISTWPAGATRYLYGVYFFEFVNDSYGDESVQKLIEEYSDNLLPFAMNSTFRKVFRKDVSAVWKDYAKWLKRQFEPEIQMITERGIVAGDRFSASAYNTGSVRVVDDVVYYIENSGREQAALVKVIQGRKTALAEVQGTDFDVYADGRVLISQPEICSEYSIYSDLYVYREGENGLDRLTKCGRYTRAIWHPDGHHIFAIKHEASEFSLQQLNENGEFESELIRFDTNAVVGWFDVSPNARQMVFSLWKPTYGWDLYLYDLVSKQWQEITGDSEIQAYPEYSSDGKTISYSAEYDGTYNLYQYNLVTRQHDQITRTLGGAYQSSTDGDELYYIGYTAAGTDVFHINTPRSLQSVSTFSQNLIKPHDYLEIETTQSKYSPWSSLKPRWWFPSLTVTEDVTEIGAATSGNDALGVHNYFASTEVDVTNNVSSLQFVYGYSNLFNFVVSRDNTLFKSSAGQKERIRAEDNLRFVLALPHTKLLSYSNFLFTLGWENNSDNKLFSGATHEKDFSDNLLGFAWLYNNSRVYPLSISRNNGRSIRLVAEDGSLLNSDRSGQVYTASWREYIPLGGEHVLALRALIGWGDGKTSDFRLGGEESGTSYSLFLQESGSSLFGRRSYALRGYEEGLPQLRSQRAQLFSAEWRFPGQRIERGIMTPPIGITQWSGGLFAEVGAAYSGDSPDEYYSSAGAELTADLNLFYLVPLRARLGVAHGFDQEIGGTRAYLSLGRSF